MKGRVTQRAPPCLKKNLNIVSLRQSYLTKFPVTNNVTVRRPPLLQIVSYTTNALPDIVPLRALYNDPSLLAHLPQGKFRDIIRTTISTFHYGETMDRFILNGTNVGRDYDQQSTCCISHLPRWKPYLRLTKSGRSIILTTDGASCLGNIHAQAVFELQAGFQNLPLALPTW